MQFTRFLTTTLRRLGHWRPVLTYGQRDAALMYQHRSLYGLGDNSAFRQPRTYTKAVYDTREARIAKVVHRLLQKQGLETSGFTVRRDGYVSVKTLLNHPDLITVDFIALEMIVRKDQKKRFDLHYEPYIPDLHSKDADMWWIRASDGYNNLRKLRQIVSLKQVQMAVHGTTFEAWKSISINGISTMGKEHIHLAQEVKEADIMFGTPLDTQILIFIDLPKALGAGIKFYFSTTGAILTPGNLAGFLEPRFFQKIEKVSVKTKTLSLVAPNRHQDAVY